MWYRPHSIPTVFPRSCRTTGRSSSLMNLQPIYGTGTGKCRRVLKKGTYTANLVAVDFEGNTFQGLTSTFFIGQPAVQEANLSPSEEANLKEQQAKKLATEALLLAEESQQKLAQAQGLLKGQENIAAEVKAPPPTVVAAVQPADKANQGGGQTKNKTAQKGSCRHDKGRP